MISRVEKNKAVEKIQKAMANAKLVGWTEPIERFCLHWAVATDIILKKLGYHSCIQAGTCYWAYDPPNQSGKIGVFGYEFQNSPEVMFNICTGNLPEMHVWVGLPDSQEIVDLTTGFFPAQCQRIINKKWNLELPPDWFWGGIEDLPDGVVYHPMPEAIEIAMFCAYVENLHQKISYLIRMVK